jgi:hypothetical protein|nr:MAG TPA: hypothetical protein [Bacteriophage sp.]
MWYSLKKEGNTITVKKEITSTDKLVVKLIRLDNCSDNVLIEEKNDLSQVIVTIPTTIADIEKSTYYNIINTPRLKTVSGIYQLQIKIGNYFDSIEYPNYSVLFKSVIEDIEKVLCKCPCQDCPDCKDDNKTLLDVVFKTLLYYSLTGKYYQSKLSKLLSCISCELSEESICIVLNEAVKGNYHNIKLLKKLLAIYYLAFYYTDNNTTCQATKINKTYNFDKIRGCLINLGVDLNCIIRKSQQSVTSTGDYHIYLTSYDNIPLNKKYFFETLPQYSDSFNRPISKIQIFNINMQVDGANKDRLVFNNIDVVENQEIDFSDIENNKLVFIPGRINTNNTSTFDWRITSFC